MQRGCERQRGYWFVSHADMEWLPEAARRVHVDLPPDLGTFCIARSVEALRKIPGQKEGIKAY